MFDHRDRAPFRRPARLTRRAQPAHPDLAGQRRIRLVEPERDEFVVQRRRPQVRILTQPFAGVVDEPVEAVVARRCPHAGDPAAAQVRPDRLAVMAEMAGDRRDRPPLRAERVSVHIVLPCEHETGLLRQLVVVRDRQHRGSPTPIGGALRVGNFSEQLWGHSPERHHHRWSSRMPVTSPRWNSWFPHGRGRLPLEQWRPIAQAL
jgi:hypothetical protein